jgi:hypothetical protein
MFYTSDVRFGSSVFEILPCLPACSTGGVVVTSASGLITCSNTLDERLKISYNQTLPEIRTALFGAVQRA